MKVKLSYKQIHDKLQPALLALGGLEMTGAPLEVLINISKNSVALEKHIKVYVKTKKALIEKMCEKDDKKQPVIKNKEFVIPDSKHFEFQNELDKLVDKEVEVELSTISMELLETVKELTPNILMGIAPIIEETKSE